MKTTRLVGCLCLLSCEPPLTPRSVTVLPVTSTSAPGDTVQFCAFTLFFETDTIIGVSPHRPPCTDSLLAVFVRQNGSSSPDSERSPASSLQSASLRR